MKSGVKTTEFWTRFIPMITGLMIGGGAIENDTGRQLNELAGQALPIVQAVIDGVIQLVGLLMSFWLSVKYGHERAALKMSVYRASVSKGDTPK